jgi:predicted metal-dependent hydrolase
MKQPGNDEESWPIQIVRSQRRRKSVNAQIRGGVLVVQAPAHLSDADLAPMIDKLQAKLQRKLRPVPQSDDDLEERAQTLNQKYFDGQLRWRSIRYVTNQTKRHGSCSPTNGTIRLSNRLATLPEWVRDYVIMHELAHLLEANHGPQFWKLVNRYPLAERSRGYLMALDLEEQTKS